MNIFTYTSWGSYNSGTCVIDATVARPLVPEDHTLYYVQIYFHKQNGGNKHNCIYYTKASEKFNLLWVDKIAILSTCMLKKTA